MLNSTRLPTEQRTTEQRTTEQRAGTAERAKDTRQCQGQMDPQRATSIGSIHTPSSIAAETGVSPEWIRRLCRRVLKQRGHHRLTAAQRAEVVAELERYRRKNPR